MNEKLQENISALMDDDLSEQERDAIIGEIARDEDSLKAWSSYHLIRDSLQGQLHEYSCMDMVSAIREELDKEPVVLAPVRKQTPQWQRPLAGFAIAASVALVAVLGVRSIESPQVPDGVQVAQVSSQLPVQPQVVAAQTTETSSAGPVTVEYDPATVHAAPNGPRLNGYLVNHYERKSNFGMLPYVRIVGYETKGE